MNRVVELGAQDKGTLGRAFSCGTSNAGVYPHSTVHGEICLRELHFGISQAVSAPTSSLSSVTVDGKLCLSMAYCEPIWNREQAEEYLQTVLTLLEMAADSRANYVEAS